MCVTHALTHALTHTASRPRRTSSRRHQLCCDSDALSGHAGTRLPQEELGGEGDHCRLARLPAASHVSVGACGVDADLGRQMGGGRGGEIKREWEVVSGPLFSL